MLLNLETRTDKFMISFEINPFIMYGFEHIRALFIPLRKK